MTDTPVFKYTIETSNGPIEETIVNAASFFIDADRDCQFFSDDKAMVHFVRTPLRVWKVEDAQ